ncbi:DUF3108 domain-containing protein [Pandoraea terrae]|uniref:DUF3108 domain-containing protein n=1 Tax=Pandoraea terrae TaxID=1537710 RepID=UPI00123FD313|nr:DUF3108 domain-containing protein [Pandoraea terrae]
MALTVLAVHGGVAWWVAGHRTPLDDTPVPEVPIVLIPLRPVAPPAPPAPRPKPRAVPKPAPAKPAPPDTLAAPATAVTPGPAPSDTTQAGAGDTASATSASAATASSAAAPADTDRFDPPPTVTLTYDALMNGVRNQTGELHWVNDNGHYALNVAVPIIFFGTFEFTSAGSFDANGIAPSRYVEKRGRRAEYVTDFRRDAAPALAFSRTGQTAPLAPGAQDRFSVMMQLAGLVRGNPERYAQLGVTHEFTVADTDSSEVWPVQYVGKEMLRGPDGYLETRHFTRLPRKDGDRRRVDIWLAPELGWLPVRVRQVEPSGNEFELIFQRKTDR